MRGEEPWPKKKITKWKVLQLRGLRKRWIFNTVMPVLALLVLIVVLFSTGVSSYYYQSMEDGLTKQVQAQAGAFNDYFMDNGYTSYYQKAVQCTTDFEDKGRIEMQFINSAGRIQISSTSNLLAGTAPGTSDITDAIAHNEISSYHGRDPETGETILAVSHPLTSNGKVVGVMRLVTSLRSVNRQVMLAVLAICLIAAIIYSCYGIFFSGEDTGTGITMQAAVAEINEEYSERLDHLKEENEHEVFRLSGSRAPWKDVLAVYAVKVNTDSENPQVVANLTEEKKELLRGVFWDMNTISHQIGRETITEIVVQTDEKGNAVEKEQTVEKTVLTVSVTHKPAEEMAARYFFNPSQKAALTELLAPEFDTLWTGVLSGMISDGGGLVAVARSQVGNIGGELYWSWYGFESHVEWCACFVSWCADQCGYIDAGLLPKFAACTSQGVPWFQERGQWQDNTYTPNPGDLIFLIGIRTNGSIMWESWKRWKTAGFIPSRATPVTPASRTAILWEIPRFMDMGF